MSGKISSEPETETRGVTCKHIYTVRFAMKQEKNSDSSETITKSMTFTETLKRKTHRRKWPEFNTAQTSEKRHFQELLRDLYKNVPTPIQTGKGQRAIPRGDAIFAAVFNMYFTCPPVDL